MMNTLEIKMERKGQVELAPEILKLLRFTHSSVLQVKAKNDFNLEIILKGNFSLSELNHLKSHFHEIIKDYSKGYKHFKQVTLHESECSCNSLEEPQYQENFEVASGVRCKSGDILLLEKYLIFALVIEPIPCNMGIVLPQPGFLEGLRKLCTEHKSLLIFDEVITGFRFRFGSISDHLGVYPDLIAFGKIIGGGTPIGAYGGKKEIMKLLESGSEGVFQGGTFAGNPISMAAGLGVLTQLEDPKIYDHLEKLGDLLETELKAGFKEKGIPYKVIRKGSVFSLAFVEDGREINSFEDVSSQNFEMFTLYHREMLKKGFLLSPAAYEVFMILAGHSQQQIKDFIKATIETLTHLRK